jgi:WD40 repeat protein
MTDRLDFEARLEQRLRARAAIASRPFDAAVIAHRAALAGGRRRFGWSLRQADRPALRWAVLVLLTLALLAAAAVAGSRLLQGPKPLLGSWTATVGMINDHTSHTATLLPDGKVLVAGGWETVRAPASAELYDPSTGSWTPTGAMINGRAEHTATLLPDGRVLAMGGVTEDGAAVELYDPRTGTWKATGKMTVARHGHTATLLLDGRVLVAGGADTVIAELYDPRHGTWSATGNMVKGRHYHTATLLSDGRVLVAGDYADFASSAELYDPRTGTWTATGSMIHGRWDYTATLLPDGTVLVAGTEGDRSAELYDPRSGIWTATGSMMAARHMHTATLLPNGTVLVTGGGDGTVDGGNLAQASAELYDPSSGRWTATAIMDAARRMHTATLLPDGTVLVAGGDGDTGSSAFAQLYHPGSGN